MRTTLFRQEALDHQQVNLLGAPLAESSLPFWLVTGLSTCAALAIVALAVFGEYVHEATQIHSTACGATSILEELKAAIHSRGSAGPGICNAADRSDQGRARRRPPG